LCSYTAFWHFSGSLDGPDRTDGKVRPASGSACGPFGVAAVAFIVVAQGLTSRIWVTARMPERGILVEEGPAGRHGEMGEEPALHEGPRPPR